MRSNKLGLAVATGSRLSPVSRVRVVAGLALAMTIAGAAACSGSGLTSSTDDGGSEDGSQVADGSAGMEGGAGNGGADGTVGDGTVVDGTVGTGSVGDGAAPDGTGSDAASSDATTLDAADAPSDGPAGDSSEAGDGQAAAGVSTLWLGGNLALRGITTDNYIVYFDSSTRSYYARPLAGGTPTLIYALPTTLYGDVIVVGRVVFIFGWGNYYAGKLTSWTSSVAQPGTLTSIGLAYLYQTIWASADGQYVMYLQGRTTSAYATVSDLYGANADGTGVTLLAASVDTYVGDTSCFPRVAFRGDHFVASYCTTGDAGSVPIIQSFEPSNGWASAVVVTNWIDQYRYNIENTDPSAFPFAIDSDGGRVIAASSTSGDASLQVFAIDGGPGAVLDPSWQLSPSLSFAGSKVNPWFVYYNTNAGALWQTPVASPAPQMLLDGGVNYFDGYSRDGKWLLASNATNQAAFFADVSIVSTVNPGRAQLIATSAQSGGLPVGVPGSPNQGFTTDLGYAIVYTDMVKNNAGNWTYDVLAASVGSPTAPEVLSKGYATDTRTLQGSKVLLLDNFVDTDGGAGSSASVDLHIADPSTFAAPTLVASRVPGNYVVTPDLSTIVYANPNGTPPGVYRYIVP